MPHDMFLKQGDVIKCKHFPHYWPFVWPSQKPVTRSFDISLIRALNKRLSKQSWGCWFDMPSRSLWRQCNEYETILSHDDIMTWKRLLFYWPFVTGIRRSPMDSIYKETVMWGFDIFFVVSHSELLNKPSSCQILVTEQRQCDVIIMCLSQTVSKCQDIIQHESCAFNSIWHFYDPRTKMSPLWHVIILYSTNPFNAIDRWCTEYHFLNDLHSMQS